MSTLPQNTEMAINPPISHISSVFPTSAFSVTREKSKKNKHLLQLAASSLRKSSRENINQPILADSNQMLP